MNTALHVSVVDPACLAEEALPVSGRPWWLWMSAYSQVYGGEESGPTFPRGTYQRAHHAQCQDATMRPHHQTQRHQHQMRNRPWHVDAPMGIGKQPPRQQQRRIRSFARVSQRSGVRTSGALAYQTSRSRRWPLTPRYAALFRVAACMCTCPFIIRQFHRQIFGGL
jgi:hypothetical protein